MVKRTSDQDVKLKAWLLAALETASDADPALLTDFVFALLSNNENLTKNALSEELAEFLETDATTFINELFQALETGSYLLPYSKANLATASTSLAPTPSIPTGPRGSSALPARPPTGPQLNTRKRQMSPPAGPSSKSARTDGEQTGPSSIAVVDDTGTGRRGFQDRVITGSSDMLAPSVAVKGGAGSQAGYVRKKGMCYNYHERGYCPRGMECPYEHSPDSIYAPSQPSSSNGQFQMPGFPPFPMMQGFPVGMPMGMMPGMGGSPPGPGLSASPFAGRMAGSPAGLLGASSLDKGKAPAKNGDVEMLDAEKANGAGVTANGGDDNSYSPNQPGQAAVQSPPIHPMSPGGMPMPGMDFGMGMMGYPPMMGMPPNMMMGMPGPSGLGFRGRGRGGVRGGPRGGMNGMSFGGQTSNRPAKEGTNNTLVITDVPPAFLSLDAVHNHFKQFGTVTNVALEAREKKALVAFSSAHEAHAAWKSDEPVFNSRHVKVLWHRPMEGHGSKGQEALEASAPLLQNMRKIEAEGVQAIQGSVVTSHERQTQARARLDEIQAQQRVMEKYIAEQKVLFARLEAKPTDLEEKRSIKTRLKDVSKELDSLKPIDMAELQSLMAVIKPTKPLPRKKLMSNPAEGVHSVEEMLDHDMEGEVDADTLALREKVKQLRAQAESVGIDPDNLDGSSYAGRGRGRGRGRGAASRGRGGPPRMFKLDNRTRIIAVDGEGVQSDAGLEALRAWYAPYGMVGKPEISQEKVIVSFESRQAAEQAMARGTEVPSLSTSVTTSWHTDTPGPETGDTGMDDRKTRNDAAEDGGRRGERRDDD